MSAAEMELTTLLFVAILTAILFYLLRPIGRHLPPFPVRPLPVVGNIFHMGRDSRQQLKDWRGKCGDIYSLYLGNKLVVVLHGYDLLKEVLAKKGDATSDRPKYFNDQVVGLPESGVTFSSGHLWKEHRAATLSILKSFGMGKNILAEKILEEVSFLLNYLSGLNGEPVDIKIIAHTSASNIICSILLGQRFDYDDDEFQDLMFKLSLVGNDQDNVNLVNYFFWLKYIPGDFFNTRRLEANATTVLNFMKKFIKEKKRNMEPGDEADNFIDAYLSEMRRKIEAGENTKLDEERLPEVMNDLFGAGSDTASTTIYWCVLYMLNFPDIQEKVYEEIREKVGTDRLPNIQDKVQLSFLTAVIMETQRLASIVPFALPHLTSEEIYVRNYTLPKGTTIIPSLDSVLHDPTVWGTDVMSFRPERFLDESHRLVTPEHFIPFGIGKRACLGEAMARTELFLFLAAMFQRFQFVPVNPGCPPPMDYVPAVLITPRRYQVRLLERK